MMQLFPSCEYITTSELNWTHVFDFFLIAAYRFFFKFALVFNHFFSLRLRHPLDSLELLEEARFNSRQQ